MNWRIPNKKIIRPDSDTTKRFIKEAAKIDAELQEIITSEDLQRQSAQNAAKQLYNERIRKTLEEMDIEHINNGKQGIRVSLLRAKGIENVYQASQLSFQKICNIEGLGEQSARKILEIVKQITKNTKDTIQIRIQIDNPHKVDDDLVQALYTMIHSHPIREQCSVLYKNNHAELIKELKLAKKALNGLGWIFKSRTKKELIISAIERIR